MIQSTASLIAKIYRVFLMMRRAENCKRFLLSKLKNFRGQPPGSSVSLEKDIMLLLR